MAFKFVIRHNIEQTADDFDSGDVRSFSGLQVWVGSGEGCECRVEGDEGLRERHFEITSATGDTYEVVPAPGAGLFVNGDMLETGARELLSGDEIRVGHLTFRFQKVHRAVGQARRADLVAVAAKLLVAVVLLLELVLVYWLPRRFQSERLLALEIRKQETTVLLDQLRGQTRTLVGERKRDALTRGAAALLLEELDDLAAFLRGHDYGIGRDEWDRIYQQVHSAQQLVRKISEGTAIPALPRASLDRAVKQVLASHGEGSQSRE